MAAPVRRTTAWAAAAAAAAAVTLVAAPLPPPAAAVAADAWRTLPASPPPGTRQETSLAVCGPSLLCMAGGRGVAGVARYNTTAGTWATGASPPMQMHHFQATTGPDGCVWVAGAFTGNYPNEGNVGRLYTYCAAADVWAPVPGGEEPNPRGASGAVWHGGRLHIVAGNVGGHGPGSTAVSGVDVFDPAGGGSWSTLPDVPHARDHVAVAVVGGRYLVVAGGRDSGTAQFFKNTIPDVDILDLTTGTWLPDGTAPPFPTPRAGAGTAPYAGGVLVVGGEGNGQAYAAAHLLTRGATGGWSWATLPPLAEGRHGIGAVACGGAVYTAGGAGNQGSGNLRTSLEALFEGAVLPPCARADAPATPTPGGGAGGATPAPGGGGGGATPAETDESACFPADATVETRAGRVRLDRVRTGTAVRVVSPAGAPSYSPIIAWSHADPSAVGVPTVELTVVADGAAAGGGGVRRLRLTPGHLLPAGPGVRLVPASAVRVGDGFLVAAPPAAPPPNATCAVRTPGGGGGGGGGGGWAPATVVAVTRSTGVGVFAPHVAAPHAYLLVDGVAVSDRTTALPPAVAAAGLAVVRAVWAATGWDVTGGGLARDGGGVGGGVRRAAVRLAGVVGGASWGG